MSIIIRLQNLPWSANAENIRQFFGSLVIPDGGVHIVGGEHGDAFIAFGSDEDARQAMAKDGGDIKGVKVRLLLSSRVEMQKVIDAARQQALSSQNLLHTLSAVAPHLPYDPSAPPAMPVGLPPHLLSALPGLVNLPALNALPMMPNMPAGLTPMPFPMPVASAPTARTVETKAAPTLSLPLPRAAAPANSSEQPADKKKESAQLASSRGQKASESRSRSRSGSRSRDRRGYRDKYRGRDSRSGDRKYRRERSKSRDREKRSERSRSRDRHRRRSRSRERRNEERGRDHRNRSKERRRDSERSSSAAAAAAAKKDEAATASAAKAAYKAAYGNAVAGAPLAAGKAALDEIRTTTAGASRPDSAAAAKSSPSADAAKASVETRATWPSGAAQQSAAAWTAAIPTPPERKAALDSPKTADANVGGGGSSAPTSTAAALPHLPTMPAMPTMPLPGMSMPSAMPYSMAAAYSMAYAAAAPNGVYAMNRFPLTAQQAAALYSGYPMGMMGQPNLGQFQPAASAASAPAQQLQKADAATANGSPDEGDDDDDADADADAVEEEEVDCFGRVRKKSRRPSYSPERKSGAAAFENGDRRDSYRSRMDGSLGGSGGGKPYNRDSYHSDENRFHRSAAEDGGFRKTPYRRNLDRHDGGGDERRARTERRGENAAGDRRNYSRFDGGGDDERKTTPAYDGRRSRTEERGGDAAATGEYRRNSDRYGGGDDDDDDHHHHHHHHPERPFRASRFDEPRRNAAPPYSNVEQLEAEEAEEMAAVHAQQQQHEYGAGSSPLPVVFQTCVEVRNVAAEVTERDVKRFFEPLPLFDSCIKFQYKTHGDGSHSTSVLVKFVNEAQRAQALQLSGKFLRGQRTLILECEQRAFEQAEDMAVRLQQPYLKLVFVPKRATPDDIANAFTLPPDEVVIVQQNGRESLEAYLKFGDTQPAVDALKHKDKVTICNSRVKLAAIPEAEFDAAKMHAKASAASAPPGSLPASGNYVVEGGVGDGDGVGDCQPPPVRDEAAATRANGGAGDVAAPPLTCVHFASLPADVTDKDIVRFLQDVDVTPHRIHIMYSADGQPSGEAFCEFVDEAAVQRALQKDRCLMNDYIVEMTAISAAQLEAAVNEVPEEYEPQAGAGPQPYHQGGFAGGRGSRPYAARGGPRRPYGAGRGQYGGDARGGGGGGGDGGRRPMPPVGPDQFGRPGCVVSLENVPYKANVDDILRFFGDFEVTRNNVIRRYNENNMATGDARVCLQTPGEAIRAARTLDRQKIGDRVITVRLPR